MAEYARKNSQQQATRRSYNQRFIWNRQNLNFPVFRKGDDPQLWIHIANQHFDLYQIPNQFKVSLSKAYVDDEVKCYQKSLSDVNVSWEDWSWLLYEEFNKAQYGFNEERFKEYVDDHNNNLDKITSFVEEIVSNQQKDVEQHTVPESIAPNLDVQPQICQEVDSTPKADDQPQICQAIDSTPNLDEHIRSDSFTHITSFDSELVNGLLGEDEMFSMLGKSEFRISVEMDNKSIVVHERLENAHHVFVIMIIRGIENVGHKVSVIMGKALKVFENMTENEGGHREGFVYDLLAHVVEHTYKVLLIHIMDQMYDVLLSHGGATGCGVALDAVTRGIRVRLVEREDCSYETSSLAAGLVCTAALAGAAVLNQGMKVQLISFNGKSVFSAAITSDGLFSLQVIMFVIKVIEQWYVLGLVRAVGQVHEVLLVRVCVAEQTQIGQRQMLLTLYGKKGNEKIIAFVVGLRREYHVDIKGVVLVYDIKLKGTSQQVDIQVMEIFSISKVMHATKREIEIEDGLKVNVQLGCVNRDNTCLNYRVFDMRTLANQLSCCLQYQVENIIRPFLINEGFVGIHITKLIGGTSKGGPAVFKLDYKGQSACLAQSSRTHKQMTIMVIWTTSSLPCRLLHSTLSHGQLQASSTCAFTDDFYKTSQKFTDFYRSSLVYLTYVSVLSLSESFKLDLAFDSSLAALLGESTVDTSKLLASCAKIDHEKEYCEQIFQNAITEIASTLALRVYDLSNMKETQTKHSSRVDGCKSIVLRWLAGKLDASHAEEVLRGLSNCNINKACRLVYYQFNSFRNIELQLNYWYNGAILDRNQQRGKSTEISDEDSQVLILEDKDEFREEGIDRNPANRHVTCTVSWRSQSSQASLLSLLPVLEQLLRLCIVYN